jgi:phosphoribosylglycinamide formyltransferase-1
MSENRRIAFFCSGAGGNFHFIRICIEQGLLPGVELAGAVVEPGSSIGRFCDIRGIPWRAASFDRGQQQQELAPFFRDLRPSVIVTNVHKVLDVELLNKSPAKLINQHYSLLPAFGGVIGMKAVEQAIEYGARIVGCTVHHVTAEVDAGPPIAQIALPLSPIENMNNSLANSMFRAAALCLLGALLDTQYRATSIMIEGRHCLYSGPEFDMQNISDREPVWREVREATGFSRTNLS